MAGSFTFDGKEISFEDGDTIASALTRAGVRVLSRSMKYHRPRGAYCYTGSCAGCMVEVDGAPNQLGCLSFAHACEVRSQNRMGSAKRDLLGVVDKVYRKGFDPHSAFTRPRILNSLFLRGVRFMSGVGRAPKEPGATTGTRHQHVVDELVVGGGRHGLQRASETTGDAVLLVDELNRLGGSLRWDPSESETRPLVEAVVCDDRITTWTGALAFGIYDDVVAIRRGNELHEVRANRITIAPGTHDGMPLFDNNDLPGIVSLRGAKRLLWEHGIPPGKRVVVHGAPLPPGFEEALQQAGVEIAATGDVGEAKGGAAVAAADVDGRRVECDAILCNIPGTRRVELFQQAGCTLTFDEGGLGPRLDDEGGTSVAGIYGAFSDPVTEVVA